MYLTAQFVRSRDGVEGVNAYLSLHGPMGLPMSEDGAPDLERSASSGNGVEVVRSEAVRPGGNAVRAYFDLAAPDACPDTGIIAAVEQLADLVKQTGLPASVRGASVAARAWGVEEVASDRQATDSVLDALRVAALSLLPRRGGAQQRLTGPLVVHAGYAFGGVRLWLPPVTLARLPVAPMRRLRLLVPEELMQPPYATGEVLREAAQLLLGCSAEELHEAGGLEILDPRTATVFVGAAPSE